jgi:hypothetical protein
MSIKFNPFTSNFDFVGTSSSPTPVPTFELVISDLADWGSPSGGIYTLTILAATHGKGTKPLVQALETTALTFTLIGLAHQIDSLGNITLEVTETPDNRFLGKILIGE